MINFKQLNQEEYNNVWNKFCDMFHFKPSVSNFKAIKTDKPWLKFDIKDCISPNYPLSKLEDFAINIFNRISKPGDRLYALDWQHTCYDFNPRQQMDRDEFGDWVVPILPIGDYYIFLTKDFNNVWFGHPWEQTITLIGEDIIEYAQKIKTDFPK